MQISKILNLPYIKANCNNGKLTKAPFCKLNQDLFERNADVNFTSAKVADVNLKRRTTKRPIEAYVAQLDFSLEDKILMTNLYSLWSDTDYMESISNAFLRKKNIKTFVVAAKTKKNLSAKDVKSVFCLELQDNSGKRICNLKYLQSASDIADNPKSSIRGAGELALYYTVKYAKENGCNMVSLTSTNNSFYENAGFEMGEVIYPCSNICSFYLDENDYDSFLKKIEEKYKF